MNIPDEEKKLRGLLDNMFQHSCTVGPGVSKEFKAAQRAVEAKMETLLVQRANAAVETPSPTADTPPTRCLTQWPWVGSGPGGACGPDATVGGLRSECHHRCAYSAGHPTDRHWCECGAVHVSGAQPALTTCSTRWAGLCRGIKDHTCAGKPGHDGPHTCIWCVSVYHAAPSPESSREYVARMERESIQPLLPTWRPIDTLSKRIPGGWKLFLCQGSPLLLTSHEGWAPPDATHWCPLPVLP